MECQHCIDQLLEADPPDQLIIVNNNGSPAYFEQGITPIPNGVAEVVVTFAVHKASIQFTTDELSVENVTDASPLGIEANITARSVAGFTASLSGVTDSANYRLRWTVEVTTL